ncbi:MAG TPA: hypothetical protein VJI98_05565 [Candidatus Nanoarchaeia archaeon]|nr:hypothetical protein [Candidatus Nanoarchaeia archaeon]
MEKRAITTVMMTVLAITLVLAAGLFLFFFFFGPPVEEIECGLNIDWKFLVVSGKEDICYRPETKELRFTVENGLIMPLEGIYVKIEDKNNEKDFLLDEAKVDPAGAFVGKIKFDLTKDGPLNSIQLIPVVLIEGEEAACIDDILEKQLIELCD